MGKHELAELRKQAERATTDADRFTDFAGQVAIAKAIMYAGELLADRLDTPAPQVYIKPPTPTISISDHFTGTKESPVPICTDGDCSDAQYHTDHSTPADIMRRQAEEWSRDRGTRPDPNIYTMSKELSSTRAINAEMLATLEWIVGDDWNDGIGSWEHVRDRIEATIANAKGEG